MGRRSDIDWERIERLYLAGQLTLQQIADECGINIASLVKRAKKYGWQRNLAEAIKERAKAKISTIDVAELVEQSASESAEQSAKTLKSAIEQASDIAAGVLMKHRTSIRDSHERAKSIEVMIDQTMSAADNIRDVATLAGAFKAMVEARGKLIDQERRAFGLDDDKPADDKPASVQMQF